MAITHSFVSAIPDGADSTVVRPSNWNANHTIDLTDMFVPGEIPTGTIDGANVTFTLLQTPKPVTTLAVYRNGVRQRLTTDYTLSGVTITFIVAPVAGDGIICDYWRLP